MKKIAFIGIDGVGKSTLIRKIKRKLEQGGKTVSVYYMGLGRDFRMPFFKRLISIYSRIRYRNAGKINKKGEKIGRDNFRQRGFFWVLIQYLEFWFRYWRSKKEKTDYILFDRYFYDGLILARGKSFNFFKRFTPILDKCFLIFADPEVIRKRKQEANIQNILDFYTSARLLDKHFKIHQIDNNRDLNSVISKILQYIEND